MIFRLFCSQPLKMKTSLARGAGMKHARHKFNGREGYGPVRFIPLAIVILLVLMAAPCRGQHIEEYLEGYKATPYQKLYLHTDREFYFSGDTVWFSAYLLDGNSHKPVPEINNLYVELIGSNGKAVVQESFMIQHGLGSGYLHLGNMPDPDGNFLLRATTGYLKNFGEDGYYKKIIALSSVKSSLDMAPDDLSADLDPDMDVRFMPEGGFLLEGVSNCIAYRAVDKSGKGKDISGKVFDRSGNEVLEFTSIYKGSGKFYLKPEKGEKYTVRLDGNPARSYAIPEAMPSGAKLMLVSQTDENLRVAVLANNILSGSPGYLVCMHRGQGLFYIEIGKDKLNTILKLDAARMGSGINRLVLLDSGMKPLSERLIYVNNSGVQHLNVEVSRQSFSTRENVSVTLSGFPEEETAFLSVSVVDENYVSISGVDQNMVSYLMLDSELKGSIEAPAGYLTDDGKLSSAVKLDLLMITHGWSNYIWNQLENNVTEPDEKPGWGFSFSGEVLRTFGRKPLPEGIITMVFFQHDTISAFFTEPLNESGRFDFSNIIFFDTASVFVQARNKNDRHNVQLKMNMPRNFDSRIDRKYPELLNNWTAIPVAVHRQRYLNELKLKEFYPDKDTRLLGEVEILGRKPVEKVKSGFVRKNDGAYTLNWEQTAGSPDIVHYLAYKVPGVHPFVNSDGLPSISLMAGALAGEPAFVIDGFQVFTAEEVQSYPVEIFESIEIITPPMSNFYGPQAYNGAVVLRLKTGESLYRSNKPLLGGMVEKIKGYASHREFYSPAYTAENIDSGIPDFRNTLYWNPLLISGDGNTGFSFFTCDNLSRYRIFVEGITAGGTIFTGSAGFEVNSRNVSPGNL